VNLITITLNGEKHQLVDELSLEQLIDHLSLPKQRVAVEHNGRVVRRTDWPAAMVRDEDRLEVVHFVGGG